MRVIRVSSPGAPSWLRHFVRFCPRAQPAVFVIAGHLGRISPFLTHQRKRSLSSGAGWLRALGVSGGVAWCFAFPGLGWCLTARGRGMLRARVASCGARVPAALAGPVSSRPYVAQAGSAAGACPDSVQPGSRGGTGDRGGLPRVGRGVIAAADDHAGSPSPASGRMVWEGCRTGGVPLAAPV